MGAPRRGPVAPAVLALAAGLWLAGCESTPRPGDTVHAQVTALPLGRGDLEAGFTSLHAALRAGVSRAEAQAGRLLRAQCLEVDAGAGGSLRPRTATLLQPEGMTLPVGALLDIDTLRGAHAADSRRHGRFVALAPVSTPASDPAAWRTVFGGARPLCRPDGLPEGRWRVQAAGPVAAWELDFAQAELQRHGLFDDAELAAGRVVQVSCQLKVVDGSDWTRVTWLARRATGTPALQKGDVVRLRAGAEEFGDARGPLAEVLGPAPGVAAPGGTAIVRCR